ncbi:AbiTii domain-containing protein [Hymenobacter psychrotolerans]|nr:hypothetical protein [Hymenobacter psychrotolerans]
MMTAPELISAAIDDALQPATRLTDVLLKVKALAYLLKDERLKEWANLEIGGYQGSGQKVPAYRKVGVVPKVHLIHKFTGQQLPNQSMAVEYLEEDLKSALVSKYVGNGVAEIEHMATQTTDGTIDLPHPINAVVAQKAYHEDWHIHRSWQVIPTNQLVGVVTSIRSKVVDLLFELQDLGNDITLRSFQVKVQETVSKVLHSIQVGEGGILNISHGANSVQATNTGQDSSLNAATGKSVHQSG